MKDPQRMNHLKCSRAALLLVSISFLCLTPALSAQQIAPPPATTHPVADPAMAAEVRQQVLHAWSSYKQYAWGHDELRPLSKQPFDWYGTSLLMTPVDALDTLILLGLNDQADEDRKLIDEKLSFDQDIYVKNFEITIRLLGGLLSSYQLTGDKRLLALADDLGTRLLPAFNSPTGLPYVFVNLRTGAVRGDTPNPAEAGTYLLEFGTLSKLTGKPIYYQKAKRAMVELYNRRSPLGLIGSEINVRTGAWTNPSSEVGSGTDSYYEYLLKAAILFNDKVCEQMWRTSLAAINQYIADPTPQGLWYGQVNMATGARTTTQFGALDAYLPAVLALSGDLSRARQLEASCFRMWTTFRIEPELLDYRSFTILAPGYELRPEIIESAFYLDFFTGDPQYLKMGQTFLSSIVKYTRNDTAFAAIRDVRTMQQRDDMESFFFAETLKYLYLIAKPDTVNLDTIVFNTEAHPLRRTW